MAKTAGAGRITGPGPGIRDPNCRSHRRSHRRPRIGRNSTSRRRCRLVPAQRMKAGREHRVALCDAAIAILSAMERKGDRVFPISDMAMLMLLRRMGRTDLTVHGFRSTFTDWVSEQTGFPREVREMALAHQVGDKVEAGGSRRGDLFAKRRQLAEAWARFCLGGEAEVIALMGG